MHSSFRLRYSFVIRHSDFVIFPSMTPARFQTIEEIFRAALDQKPDQISAFLDTACEGDELLRRKVEALLASRERVGNFIETSAAGIATRIIGNGQADSLVGQTFGHYKISKRIGTGGMGEVYLATDITAGRKAALKLLPVRFTGDVERLKRFQREARAVVGLNHPNILTVYEIGEHHSTHYIASEVIEGETLRQRLMRGPMQLSDAIDVAIQVTNALTAAHETGIVHRDIKPENIMLRRDGYVKVLDFGIAKLAESAFAKAAADGAGSMTLVETNLGSILGTVRYMSPEQACGGQVDKGTDIWNLGVVLYEMVTGHAPFTGDTPGEAMSSILEMDPPPLTKFLAHTPAELQQIISKTLRKNREERYHSAHELLEALKDLRHKLEFGAELDRATAAPSWLRWTRSPTALVLVLLMSALALALPFYWHRNLPTSLPPEKRIAVLPFENLSAEKDDAFFTAGFQDDVLTALGKIKKLQVIGRASVRSYGAATVAGKLRDIGRTLRVSHVLEGSVRRSSNRVVINVALLDTRDDRQVWSERYERTLTDTLSLQGELAIEIARALHANLTLAEESNLAVKPTENPDAYVLYLRARELEVRFAPSEADYEAAIKLYQQAVDLDPQFALARARLSIAISGLTQGNDPSRKTRARAEAEEALRLRPRLGEARLAIAYCYFFWEKDYDRALIELSRAAELMPSSAEVPLTAAFIYKWQNKFRERIAALERATILEPRDTNVLNRLYMTFRWVRNWPEALRTRDQAKSLLPLNDRGKRLSYGRAWDEFRMAGNIDSLKELITNPLSGLGPEDLNLVRYQVAVLERDYPAAERFLGEVPSKVFESFYWKHPKSVEEASLAVARGADQTTVKRRVDSARREIETILSAPPRFSTRVDELHYNLGLIYAFIGRKEDAIREGRLGVELSTGPMEKNEASAALALIYARLGESDEAVQMIEHLLTVPAEFHPSEMHAMTLTELKCRWQWDPLRSNARFQKILAGPEPKTIY